MCGWMTKLGKRKLVLVLLVDPSVRYADADEPRGLGIGMKVTEKAKVSNHAELITFSEGGPR